MVADYNYIFESYDPIVMELNKLLALEAEGDAAAAPAGGSGNTGNTPVSLNADPQNEAKQATQTPNTSNESKQKKDENFFDKIDKYIEKIIKALNVMVTKLSNRLSYSLNSDDGFEKALNKQMTTVKPLDNVTVTTYEYHLDNGLDKQITLFLNTTRSVMEWATKAPSPANNNTQGANTTALIQNIERSSVGDAWLHIFQSIEMIPKDKNIKNPETFSKYLIDEFRKDKVRLNFPGGANINKYKAIAFSMRKYSTMIKGWIESAKKIKDAAEKFDSKHKLNTSQLSPTEDEKYKEKIKKNISLTATLFSGYSKIANQYFEMRLEYSRNYQIILRAFYGM